MFVNKENTTKAVAGFVNKPGAFFQPKLTVNQPDDIYEQEADATAEKVMRMPAAENVIQPFFKPALTPVQRKCKNCEEEEKLQRKENSTGEVRRNSQLDSYVSSLGSLGQPLPETSRKFFEPRFGHDFSNVQIHADSVAAKSAHSINALAYTTGNNIVFNSGQYSPDSVAGKKLMAHELTHVVQQSGNTNAVQRLCSAAAVCAAPIPGSATDFDDSETAREAAARRRRKGMSAARSLSTGHGSRALPLETFLQAQDPGRLANVNGIFMDMDMSPGTGAFTQICADWIAEALPVGTVPPGMVGATKPCVFVHAQLNQEAFAFNTTSAPTIGGMSREEWRVTTLATLTHETQHAIFDTSLHGTPAGIATPTCTRAHISQELTELSAGFSEFPVMFRAIPAGAPAADPSRIRLTNWFSEKILGRSEGIKGNLQKMGCACECAEVDAFVRDTFNFTATLWSAAEKTAFNTELSRPVWGIRWPIAP
ncbi:MAG: eCIS core domain-containing protein [Mucilaginibacter sp.]